MHVGVLAEIDAGEMEAENFDRAPQHAQPSARNHRRAVGNQRAIEDVEIVAQLGGAGIGRGLGDIVARQDVLSEPARGGDQPRIDADDRLPVGLGSPARRIVGIARDQLLKLRRYADTRAIERQFRAEQMQLVEVEIHHALALHLDRLPQHVGVHERIAVAVAADPASHADEGGQLGVAPGRIIGREAVLEVGIELRQLVEEGVVVVGEAVGDLVDDGRLATPQQAGLPQRQNGARQGIVGRDCFLGVSGIRSRSASSCATSISRSSTLLRRTSVGCAVSTGLTRMVSNSACSVARGTRAVLSDAKVFWIVPRSAGPSVLLRAHATDLVLVFRDVGEVREIAEGAHDLDGAVVGQAVEHGFELAPRRGVALAPEGDRDLPDALDRRVDGFALLLADGVAEHAPDQTDVVPQ